MKRDSNSCWVLSFSTQRSPPLSKYHHVSMQACGCPHTNTPHIGLLFYEGLKSYEIISESPEPPVKLWIIGSDALQKSCAQVKDNLLPTQLSAHLLCAHPDMWGRSWHHHWKWLLMSSATRAKNRGLFTALPTQFSLAHSLIIISVIHPSDCNLNPPVWLQS